MKGNGMILFTSLLLSAQFAATLAKAGMMHNPFFRWRFVLPR